MSYIRYYPGLTPEQIVDARRTRARARYEARTRPGGEGVRPEAGPQKHDDFTLAEKIPPKDSSPSLSLSPSPEEPGSSSAPGPVVGSTKVEDEVKVFSGVPDSGGWEGSVPQATPEEDQVQALERIHDLIAQMQTFVTTHSQWAQEAWEELQRDFGPVEVDEVELAQPMVGIDDPPEVQKSRVIRKLPGNKWVVRPYKLSKAPEGMLFLKGNQFVKMDWVIWVKPNPYEQQGGYVLHGEYNRYGDRLK